MTGSAITQPFLLVGFGSVGRRHFRNLRALGVGNLCVYRTGKSSLPDDELAGATVFYDFDEALRHEPLAVVLANPTALHLPLALRAARAGCHLFIEKPLSHTWEQVPALEEEIRRRNLLVMVGFQFRFHPGLRQVKTWLEEEQIGPVVSATARWGEYLPAWHPWEDYTQSYSARADLGGGVVLTLCHPFDYLRWLLGEVESVQAMTSTRGGLGIDVEDTAHVLLRFASGTIGSVTLDYVTRPPVHQLVIVGQRGTISWDQAEGTACLTRAEKAERKLFAPPTDFSRNRMFVDEMRNYLFCLSNGMQPACSLNDGMKALAIALAAKRAAVEKRERYALDV